MRLFAGMALPDHVSDCLQDWCLEANVILSPLGWRPLPQHLWHLTLAFYGEVGANDADALSEQLAECAAQSPSLRLQTGHFGLFPHPMRPRVFWAGVEDAGHDKSLKRLAHCCRRAGHATVRKRSAKETAFRGHITLARAGKNVKPLDVESMLPSVPELYWGADRFSLFQSILRQQGPQYRRLETYTLKCS